MESEEGENVCRDKRFGWEIGDLEKVTDEREIDPIGGKKEGGVEKG